MARSFTAHLHFRIAESILAQFCFNVTNCGVTLILLNPVPAGNLEGEMKSLGYLLINGLDDFVINFKVNMTFGTKLQIMTLKTLVL